MNSAPVRMGAAAALPMQTPSFVHQLSGVGKQTQAKLARLQIETISDLLLHLPVRYQDRTRPQKIAQLQAGQEAVVQGVVDWLEISQGKRRSLLCLLSDGSGKLLLRFFHFSSQHLKLLKTGNHLRCFGEVRYGHQGLELVHPEYQCVVKHSDQPATLTPIYPTTDGLHQNTLRKLTAQALALPLAELFSPDFLQRFDLFSLKQCLQTLHYPPPNTDLSPYQYRLIFEELLSQQLSMALVRQKARQFIAPQMQASPRQQPVLHSLPFTLTRAQQRVLAEIQHDLSRTVPMQRLLQGDVGAGKTILAVLSALQAVDAGYQVAMMSPTELLAEQHYQTFRDFLAAYTVDLYYLSSNTSQKQRLYVLQKLAMNQPCIAMGTHALFQTDVQFNRLGLIIIDEQHRFGVTQRLALRAKSGENHHPHQLLMTATPIPRTLAMTAYADLDVSVIDELPPNRQPVQTVVLPNERRETVIARIRTVCQQGRQAYWVCTLIEESEALQCQAAQAVCQQLQNALPQLNIGLAHGRLKSADKAAVMQAFKAGKLHLLVATTVIEVGVDVPNASLMVIENAERLGLAQLHQLRGRVGRGNIESYCLLLYQAPLSRQSHQRLAVLRESHDGFLIAQRDLELRGFGEILGSKQTGLVAFKIADLRRDAPLLPVVQQAGRWLMQHEPQRITPLLQRWLKTGLVYGHVY